MQLSHDNTEDIALELLRWYRSVGVDETIADTPQDWSFYNGMEAEPVPQRRAPAAAPPKVAEPPSPPTVTRAIPYFPADPFAMAARELARTAPDLATLQAALATFDGCPLKKTAKNLCFARGNPQAKLMLIGEAPGRDEDLEGAPFVGRAGRLLDKMLAAIGLGRDEAYITNVVYWRPPGNRTPTPQEVQACQPFLQRQIELVAPEILMLLGGAAAKQVLSTDQGIMKLRGKWKDYEAGGRAIRTLATLHPAFLLRNPAAKRMAWRDLLTVKAALTGGGT
jgi:uracil-DNA glycosylase